MIALATTVSREFLPELDEGSIWLHAEMTGGISLAKAMEMDAELRKVVMEFPEVDTVVTHVGRNDDGTDPWTPSHLEAGVTLRPYKDWPSGGTKQDLIRRMAARLAELPGYQIAFSQPIIDGVKDNVFDPHSQLSVKIYGDDFNELRRIAKEIVDGAQYRTGHRRCAGRSTDRRWRRSSSRADREAAARYGINVGDIADLIQTGIGGVAVSQVFIGERHYDVTVRFREDARNSPEAIGNLRAHLELGRAGAVVAGRAASSCRPAKAPSTAT